MGKSLRILPALVVLAAVSVTAIAAGGGRDDWDREAARRKADYMFIEGQNAYSQGDFGSYVALSKRAFDLDSADLDIAAEWAVIILTETDADTLSPRQQRAYGYIKRKFLAAPDNYQFGALFSSVARNYKRYDDVVLVWETLDSLYPLRNETALNLARSYILASNDGDSLIDKALSIYDRLESGTGKNIRLSSAKIMAYLVKADTSEIRQEIRRLMDSAPEDSYTACFAGNASQIIKDYDSALDYYDLACRLDSANGEAFLAKAELYRDRGDSVAFDREVFHALRSTSLEVDTKLSILGSYIKELYSDSTQEPRIRELFGELEQVNAGEPDIHGLYGAYLYEIKDYPGSAEQFSYAVALDPSDETNWVSLVQTSMLANDTASVITYAAEAGKRFPDNFVFPTYRASMYRQQGLDDRAVEVVDSVEIGDTRNYRAVSQFLGFKGDVHASAGDTIGALALYDEAIAINPDNYMALNNAAYFIANTGGDLAKAEDYSARSLKNDALNPTYLDTYAWVFFKKKDYKMALHYIDLALNGYKQGDTDAEGAGEPDPAYEESADIYDHAGDIYFMNGDATAALGFWQKALELEPDNPLIQRKVKYKTIFLE